MLKKLIALSAVTVSLIGAAPASSTPTRITTDQSIAAGVPPLLAHLVEAAGVPVYDGNDFPEKCGRFDGRILGVYNSYYNAMVMCVQNMVSAEQYVEVFTHEAVHMAQDCRAGLENTDLYAGTEDYIASLWAELPEAKRQNLIDSYRPEDYEVETEAFFFEDYPDQVAEGVALSCF